MKIVGVELRDVYITLDFSLKELQHLLNFLDKCKVDYNGENEIELKKSVKYVTGELFPQLDKLEGDIKNGFGPNCTGG